MRVYLVNIFYAIDLLINSLFGGYRYETVSARWGLDPSKTVLYYWGCRLLHLMDNEHCQKSRQHYEKIRKAIDT